MKYIWIVMALVLALFTFGCPEGHAQDSAVHDWGMVEYSKANPDMITLDLNIMLTVDKAGYFVTFAQADGPKLASKKLTPEANKYLGIIWNSPGIANIAVSTYQLQIQKGKAFNWAEVEPAIFEGLDMLYIAMRKPPPAVAE